ncbi:hypothetical protein [Nocardioides gilvus]|uniref:hypothetical protein n=1 Tax=Nocardioides gilvus TaxID=1735589 RepID=UPI000D74DD01|nr:hypothetical protein [Nocardioides gilvus]
MRPPAQSTSSVARAEVRRLLRQGGLVTGLVVAAALGLASGLGSTVVVRQAQPEAPGAWLIATPTAVAALVSGLALALAVAVRFGGDARNGTLAATLALVPDRRRLVTAQAGAVAVVCGAAVAAVALVAGAIAMNLNDDAAHTGSALLVGTLSGALSAALLGVLGLAVAVATRHPVVAGLTLAVWWLVLPMALSAARVFLPGPLSALTHALLVTSPPMLAAEAAHPGTLAGASVTSLLLGTGALCAWAAAATTGAHALFVRRSVREGDEPGRRLIAG